MSGESGGGGTEKGEGKGGGKELPEKLSGEGICRLGGSDGVEGGREAGTLTIGGMTS